LFDSAQRCEIFVGDTLDNEPTRLSFPTKPAFCHSAVWESKPDGILEPYWLILADIIIRWRWQYFLTHISPNSSHRKWLVQMKKAARVCERLVDFWTPSAGSDVSV
jgi:hypothetical protein